VWARGLKDMRVLEGWTSPFQGLNRKGNCRKSLSLCRAQARELP
jgi:hypothetical protein